MTAIVPTWKVPVKKISAVVSGAFWRMVESVWRRSLLSSTWFILRTLDAYRERRNWNAGTRRRKGCAFCGPCFVFWGGGGWLEANIPWGGLCSWCFVGRPLAVVPFRGFRGFGAFCGLFFVFGERRDGWKPSLLGRRRALLIPIANMTTFP